MTRPIETPLERDRARIRAIASRGTFQIVFGLGFAVFAVVAAVNAASGWTVAIAVVGAALLVGSGVVARRIAARRLAAFETEHGEGAGLPDRRRTAPATPSAGTDAADAEADRS